MPISADTLRQQLDYTTWATNWLMEAASQLTPDELNHDFDASEKSVLGTLAHIYAADRIWLGRIQDKPAQAFITDADRDFALLQKEWPALLHQWKQWAAPFSDEDVLGKLSYLSMLGGQRTTPVWQIALHVVNHGTHHRGQVSGFLRAMGKVPPLLDLIRYYWELE